MKMYVAIDAEGKYLTASTSQGWGGGDRRHAGTTSDINKAATLPMKYMKQGWDQFDTSNAVIFARAAESRTVQLISDTED